MPASRGRQTAGNRPDLTSAAAASRLDHGDDPRQILIQGRSDSVLLIASGADGDGAATTLYAKSLGLLMTAIGKR